MRPYPGRAARSHPFVREQREPFELPVGAVLCGADRLHPGGARVDESGAIRLLSEPAPGAELLAIPGLRNAHVHLDLSDVRGVRRADRGFAAWVLDLLAARGPFDPGALQRGAASGARQALASGTVAVADIDSTGAAASAVAASGLKGVVFREVLGRPDPARVEQDLLRWIASFPDFAPSGRLRPGVSPHAPYSTPAGLYRAAARAARETGAPLSTHIAETLAEAQYLRDGSGEFAELLARLGAGAPFEAPPGMGPVEYLESLGVLEGALLAHVNHLAPGDLERLRRAAATVVYCPRSHAFFGHPRHPVAELREAGIPVALGTDSRASNGSLSILDELAYLRAARPDLEARTVFELATAGGARAIDGGSGRLDDGAPADLALVQLEGGLPERLDAALEAVCSGALRVIATLVSGEVCFVAPGRGGASLPLTPRGTGLFSSDSGRAPAGLTSP